MTEMRRHKDFWDKNAGRYDRFMRKDRAAYDEMYELIRPVVRHKTVLELATGTGLIAKHIVNAAAHIEATDASAEMIAEAKRDTRSAKLHFSVQDMFRLPYANQSFNVVIVLTVSSVSHSNNAQQSDFWKRNGAYLRLKNVTLGYTLPKAWTNKMGLSNIRVYANGTNLLTFTDFKYIDPESTNVATGYYPQQRTFSFGIDVRF